MPVVEIKTAGRSTRSGPPGRWSPTSWRRPAPSPRPASRSRELDAAAREVLAKAGATSPFLNYHPQFAPVPYPAVICTSVNDAALHGIPGDYRLRDGDLLSVDAGATPGRLGGRRGDLVQRRGRRSTATRS